MDKLWFILKRFFLELFGKLFFGSKVGVVKIPAGSIGKILGIGGKSINAIRRICKVQLFIKDNGVIFILAENNGQGDIEMAKKCIDLLVNGPKVGQIFKGKVSRIFNFGVFIEIFPGVEGLLHISNMKTKFVAGGSITGIKEGSFVSVFVDSFYAESSDRIRLSQRFPKRPRAEDFFLAA
ncbi:MAG: S1 RNA-binding domain-containing protein [Patescibacteria group bacterium]|nr:S1 RNA-binding domain-containing protein [Patescibacteria group bacterium]